MQKIVNFLRGTVRLELTGAFPERFLNICAAENLPFWQVEQPDEHTLRITLAGQDRRRAIEAAKRSLCQVTELGREGFPAFVGRFRKRYALLMGLSLSVAAALILSQFILVIDVTGNQSVSASEICATLSRLGFGIGSYGPSVNERELVNRALLELEDVGFLSINIKGVRAEVVVRESPKKPKIEDLTVPADVVAERDGVILEIGAKRGKKMVKNGDAVLKGEVLISGLVTHKSGDSDAILSSEQVRAAGEVWAVTERTLRRSIPLTTTGKGDVEAMQHRYALRVLGRRINFYRKSSISLDNYDKINAEYPLTLPGGLKLPLSWLKTTYTSREVTQSTFSKERAEAYLKKRLEADIQKVVGEGEVLSKEWKASERDGVLTVTLQASCNEEIGKTVELERESETGQAQETKKAQDTGDESRDRTEH